MENATWSSVDEIQIREEEWEREDVQHVIYKRSDMVMNKEALWIINGN